MPGMSEHTQQKLYDQTAASIEILLPLKNKRSISKSFFDIKTEKILQYDCPRPFLFIN